MSDELKCPLCNEKMVRLASGDFTHYYNSCPMAHENFSRYKLVVIGQVVEAANAAAEKRGYEMARADCQDCVIDGGNPAVAKERIAALVYKPEAVTK